MSITNSIKESLSTRYTSKAFKPNTKINQDHYQLILEAANMAPTSFGLQPFKIIEIKDQPTKDAILPIAFNQPQINTCDTILVFAVEQDANKSIEDFKQRVILSKRQDEAGAEGYMNFIRTGMEGMKSQGKSVDEWFAKQAYIALGYATMTAALLGVETACMEGFIAPKLDALLGLEAKGLKSVVMLTIGVGAQGDANRTNPKVRKQLTELVI